MEQVALIHIAVVPLTLLAYFVVASYSACLVVESYSVVWLLLPLERHECVQRSKPVQKPRLDDRSATRLLGYDKSL